MVDARLTAVRAAVGEMEKNPDATRSPRTLEVMDDKADILHNWKIQVWRDRIWKGLGFEIPRY